MNLYFMVEGKATERKVYRAWIEIAFPQLRRAERLEDVWQDTYRLFSIEGNTDNVGNINAALREIEAHNAMAAGTGRGVFDGLFVCVDAEDATAAQKQLEVEQLVAGRVQPTLCYPVIQNCCIETWFLGNRPMMKRQNIERQHLKDWKDFYDVSELCPEFMGKPFDYLNSKADFHLHYLQEMFRERGLSYSKRYPGIVKDPPYLKAIIERFESAGHLQSFGRLLSLWRELGGQI